MRTLLFALVTVGVAACGDGAEPSADAAADAAADAGVDAAVDAAVDAIAADAAVDGPELDAPEIDAPEIDAAVDAPEIDAPEIDAPEIDAPEIDAPEIDAAVDAPVDAPVDVAIDAAPTGASCASIHAAYPSALDGIYEIDPDGTGGDAPFTTYCDMTSDGGGWTLVSYGYRTSGTAPYYLPIAPQGTWAPAARDNVAAIDARSLLAASTSVALTVTDSALVTGNLVSYAKAYVWAIPSPATAQMTLADPAVAGCVTVSVRELRSAAAFDAYTLGAKPLQVACAGHKGGTQYERQLIGFNSGACFGVCGHDPVTSMGMVVWYGSGYSPTTSGGAGSPERPASFAMWLK